MELNSTREAENLRRAAINAKLDEREQCDWCDGPYKPCFEHRERRTARPKQ